MAAPGNSSAVSGSLLDGGSSELIGYLGSFDPVYHPVPSATDITNPQANRKTTNSGRQPIPSVPGPNNQLIDLTDNSDKTKTSPKQPLPKRKSPRTSDISIVAVKDSAQNAANQKTKSDSVYFNSGSGVQLRKPAPLMKNSKRGRKLVADVQNMDFSGVIFQALAAQASAAIESQSEATKPGSKGTTKPNTEKVLPTQNTDPQIAKQTKSKDDADKNKETTSSKKLDDVIDLASSGK